MDYTKLLQLKKQVNQLNAKTPQVFLQNYQNDFAVKFTHHSTGIEGNTLTLQEVKLLIDDNISVGGKKLQEIYEVINHKKAFDFIQNCIKDGRKLSEKIVKDIHQIVMENIIAGGIYRNHGVYISGSDHTPPSPIEMHKQMKFFFYDLENREFDNPIEFSAWCHAEFVRIHPFPDGNGRTARLILNYQLLSSGFLPIVIRKENRLDYYNALEEYSVKSDLTKFTELVAELEEKQLTGYLELASAQCAEDDLEI